MSQIAIKQEDWDSPFFPIVRKNNLVYSVDLFSIFQRSPVVEAQLQRCQFCKSFPFVVSEQPEPSKVKECELCQSLNEHDMRHYLIDKGDGPQELSNSYIMKSNSAAPNKVNLIIFIERLEVQFVMSLTAALKAIVETEQIQASVLIPYLGSLALVDFLEQPELVILSRDISVRDTIEQCKYVLTVEMIEKLQEILMMLSKDVPKKGKHNIDSELLIQILADYQAKRMNEVDILVWIGKLPKEIKRKPRVYMKIIAILLIEKAVQKNSLLFDIGITYDEVHYINGEEASTQLYYELYKILSQRHLGFILEGVPALKTDKEYSGSFLNAPKHLINSFSPATIVTTQFITPHKLQLNLVFTNFRGEHLRFISNLYETNTNRSIEWRDRVFLISNALVHVLQTYYQTNPQKPKEDISSFYIMNQLEAFSQRYENSTQAYSQLIKHMISYFKEFGKSAIKQYLPFSLIFKKELLFLFYPLFQGGILHHYDGMWMTNETEEYVDWCNEVTGVSWAPRQSEIPVFYSLCLDKGTYSFVQQ